MEKYKSDIVKAEDIRVITDRRWCNNTIFEIVRVIHFPSRIDILVEDTSQVKAYNECIKEIEQRIFNVSGISKELL